MPAVSVLIPCYNVEKYLRQCLDSVVKQTLSDMEILCINDGSTDSTPAILREYAAQDSRIRIIDKPNSGYGDSMNRGLEEAAGEYIGIVESDDWADADMFETLYRLAREHDCDMAKSNFYDYLGGSSTRHEIIPPQDADTLLRPLERNAIFTSTCYIWTAIYRRSWLNQQNIRFLPTPGASYQDTSFNFKALACARRAWFTCRAFLHYRRDNESSSIYSSGKVYCVCDEYHEIERFLRERSELTRLLPVVQKMKYQSYYWNFRRLPIPLDREFGCRAASEFAEAFRLGVIEKSLFKPKHYQRLRLWANHPCLFFLREYVHSNGRKKMMAALQKRRED